MKVRLAQAVLGGWLLLGVAGLLWPQAPRLFVGMGHDLLALAAVLSLSLLIGLPLGALAGSGPRWVDRTLSFTTDWIAAVPVVLLLAFLRPAGVSHLGNLILLGLLRSLEVGWVVRSALLRAARLDTTWAARSLGYMPLTVFVTQRLPAAMRPALAHLALTPLWTFLLDAIGSFAGLGAASSERSLGALVGAGPDAAPARSLAAVLMVLAATWALHRVGERYGLRLARK
jgi:peptide/nickel transport system permease protein